MNTSEIKMVDFIFTEIDLEAKYMDIGDCTFVRSVKRELKPGTEVTAGGFEVFVNGEMVPFPSHVLIESRNLVQGKGTLGFKYQLPIPIQYCIN